MEKSSLAMGIPGGICASKNTPKKPKYPPESQNILKHPKTNDFATPNPSKLPFQKFPGEPSLFVLD